MKSSSLLSDFDIDLFKSGKHFRLYEKLGSHEIQFDGQNGVQFAVWAPNASQVSVIGDFNGWNPDSHPMQSRWDSSGIWEVFVAGAHKGQTYKYSITNQHSGEHLEKADPFALAWEVPPKTASVIWDTWYEWGDQKWMDKREEGGLRKAFSFYEIHAGSWRKNPNGDSLSYREMAPELISYLKRTGFTHVEFMPLTEHPFYGSWGYQSTGFFAASSRFGTPQDLMYLIDQLHQEGIGVVLDWVPSHFPEDAFALARFDGTSIYEHEDPRQGRHPDWDSLIFNYGRNEVRAFLISSAMFWLDRYHIDGLRVDAVASMLYLDYSRKEGEWIPNIYGGRENLEAIEFLKEFNAAVYREYPGVHTIAEESTSWPGVSRPIDQGGLGFGMKWMMGWMHDSLNYFGRDPIHRSFHQNDITFSLIYAFHENFVLPLSHDEVVHGKGSLLSRMPGDDWQQFANLRLLYSFMYAHPGSKLLFMGAELAQREEWAHDHSLPWHLIEHGQGHENPHVGMVETIAALNNVYKNESALYELQFENDGFEWVDTSDYEKSILSWLRKDNEGNVILVLANFTPSTQENYRVGVPQSGDWKLIYNSDRKDFYGSGYEIPETVTADKQNVHGRDHSIQTNIPPLALCMWKWSK